jgi:hypothetical protein
MIPCVRVKDGVEFTTISPGGFVMLAAIFGTAQLISHDLTITSACDGEHSGTNDPHHRGEAYDVRTHDLPDKQLALQTLKQYLDSGRFYVFIEDETEENEHIHMQVAKGTVYPPAALVNNHEAVQDAATSD